MDTVMIIFYYDENHEEWAKTIYLSKDNINFLDLNDLAEKQLEENPHLASYEIN